MTFNHFITDDNLSQPSFYVTACHNRIRTRHTPTVNFLAKSVFKLTKQNFRCEEYIIISTTDQALRISMVTHLMLLNGHASNNIMVSIAETLLLFYKL